MEKLIYTIALSESNRADYPLRGILHPAELPREKIFMPWILNGNLKPLTQEVEFRDDAHARSYVNGLTEGMRILNGKYPDVEIVYDEEVVERFGVQFWAVFEDECGGEFGAGIKAITKSEARRRLEESYPESRIVQLESPEESRAREDRLHREISMGQDWDDEGRPLYDLDEDEVEYEDME